MKPTDESRKGNVWSSGCFTLRPNRILNRIVWIHACEVAIDFELSKARWMN